jgi:NTP pyrophosphatase (non-canonical NTP hydrolase)
MQAMNNQAYVKKFNDEREWSNADYMKDLLLNCVEETGEIWNTVKWLKDEQLQQAMAKNQDEFEDYVGDMLYLIYKIAYLANVDSEKAFLRTMKEYEERFPIDKVKGKHANVKAGGYDGKYGGE